MCACALVRVCVSVYVCARVCLCVGCHAKDYENEQ